MQGAAATRFRQEQPEKDSIWSAPALSGELVHAVGLKIASRSGRVGWRRLGWKVPSFFSTELQPTVTSSSTSVSGLVKPQIQSECRYHEK